MARFDRALLDQYDHYENPFNGDLTIVVPDKFVAFKGPRCEREKRGERGGGGGVGGAGGGREGGK